MAGRGGWVAVASRGGFRGGFGWLAGVGLFYVALNTQCRIFSQAFSYNANKH
jgi:hypothetical protein